MNPVTLLESLSIADLRAELEARAGKPVLTRSCMTVTAESFEHIDAATIVHVLREKQRAIYGLDHRREIYELDDRDPGKRAADGVVALFRTAKIRDNGDGTSTLATTVFGPEYSLCPQEPFFHQPLGPFGTGFLAAPDIIVTAGHCVRPGTLTEVRFVFGFEMMDATSPRLVIDNEEIYRGVEIIGREVVTGGADWALVRIDRPVTNHEVLKIRREGRIEDHQSVFVIGHPVGLPKKFADGATVRNNEAPAFFVANTDTYAHNSGSPVFNDHDRVVEGVVVKGGTDFVKCGECYMSLVYGNDDGRGEDCTRTTLFASLVP